MIDRLLAGMLRQKFLAIAIAVLLIAGGIVALRSLNVDAFPDITPVRVEVDTDAPGMASEEVEKLVTHPLEVALEGIPDAQKISSLSKFGISVVTVYFNDNTDVYWARDQVFQQIQGIGMPPGIVPTMGPNDTGTGQIFIYALKSPQRTAMQLRTMQDWIVTPALKTVPGVADNLSFGGYLKQYQVLLDPGKLRAYGVSVDDVMNAIQKNDQNAGGNFVSHGGLQYIVRGVGLVSNIRDIGDIVLTSRNGVPVFIKNVANVELGHEVRQGAVTEDGKGEVVSGITILRLGSNTAAVIARVKARLKQLQKQLPPDVRIVPLYDQSILINHSIATVRDALIMGEILVILILFVLLSNFRAALVAALAVPMCLLVAFLLMWRDGISANLLSLGGLAISIGMMIDASIVITENIYRNVTEGRHPDEDVDAAVLRGAQEIGRPVFFAILIVIAAFMPLMALNGIEGRLFIPLALSIVFSMIGSVLMAFLIAPALCAMLLRSGTSERPNRLVAWSRERYRQPLRTSIAHPWRVTIVWLFVTVMSVWLFSMTGSEFLPTLDENNFRVRCTLPTSISLAAADRIANRLESLFITNPNVLHAIGYCGRATLGGDPESVSNVEISLPLKDPRQWVGASSKAQLESQLRNLVKDFPGVDFQFSQELEMRNDELISGFNTPITINVLGHDTAVMLQKAQQIATILQKTPGAADVGIEQTGGIDNVDIVPNRVAMARYGINISDVMDVVQSAIGGAQAATFYNGEQQFAIQVRLQQQFRNSVDAIRNLTVATANGQNVPLVDVASIQLKQGMARIDRLNAQRQVIVLADVQGRSVGSVVADAKAAIARQVTIPPGITLQYGGAIEELQHALATLEWAIPGSLLLIFILVYACFGSMRDSLVVLTTIPLAIIGGTVLLLLMGLPISVPAIIGYIANFGTTVQNGTIMVSFINRWRKEGYSARDAAVNGAVERLRPELLSALIGVLALIPFLLTSGIGATVERPLAAVVVGGIALSRPIAWFLLPTLYVWFDREKDHGLARNAAPVGDPAV
ncbi:MAG: efflux RND transporter permease subunit [Armatimonadetes bacterium]|nr:efflux RND transporter permease subunit [Armatimonadota bacterium]MDE2205599.1 efflux RND transporter permease subunit [Armatimonadota bacterium]